MTSYRGRSAESKTLSFSNCFGFSSHWAKLSSLMFLILIFWVGGDLWLGDPLAQRWGAKVERFCVGKSNCFIFAF